MATSLNRKRRKLFFLFVLLFLLVGLPSLLVWRETRQQNLNVALIAAIKANHMQAALQALERGADANARDMGDYRPSIRECFRQLWERLRGRNGEDRNANKPTALLMLLDWTLDPEDQVTRPSEYEHVVQALLERGANPNIVGEDGRTPLHRACLWNSPTSVRLLLQHGAVSAQDEQKRIPLFYAASHSAACVDLLLQAGCDLNARDYVGDTPLHLAVRVGNLDAVHLLAAKGANVNSRGEFDMTPLHWTIYRDRLEIARFLLAHGADVNAKANDGYTPLYVATEYRRPRIASLLRKHGAR